MVPGQSPAPDPSQAALSPLPFPLVFPHQNPLKGKEEEKKKNIKEEQGRQQTNV